MFHVNINFIQKNGECRIYGEVTGLTPGKHGFHVHQFGDGTNGRFLRQIFTYCRTYFPKNLLQIRGVSYLRDPLGKVSLISIK